MDPKLIEVLVSITIESILYFLVFFSLIALIIGLMLLFVPHRVAEFRSISDRWLTLRKPLKSLEVPRESDPFLYRNHKWVGAIAIILPLITIYLLLYSTAEQLPLTWVTNEELYLFWQWLFDSAVIFLWISNIFALSVGIVLFFRPSLLKRFEKTANLWFSTRRSMLRLQQRHNHLDELLLNRARWTGIFLVLGSLYILVLILTFMLQHPDWLDLLVSHLYKV